jgi:CheY-like chemotaxis protein
MTEINYLRLLFQITDLPAEPLFINSVHEALKMLENSSMEEFPDFVVVDINMPLMNGFEFADIYVNTFTKKYPNTKLFIYSTSIHSKDILRAEAIEGVTAFIPKPFDEKAFNTFILPHIKMVQAE